MSEPKIIKEFFTNDDRGLFTNIECNLFIPKRIYVIDNFSEGMIRAFHGHKNEEKLIFCIHGAIKIPVAPLSHFLKEENSPGLPEFQTFVLSQHSHECLYIPKNYCHGVLFLQPNTQILVISSSSVEESLKDDYRFDYNRYGYNWSIKCR